MDVKKLISEYLNEAKVMQLATVNNGRPWVCTVNYVFDENWNLYWLSLRSRRHSQELTHHREVAGAIVKDPSIKRGLQFEGMAFEVKGEELTKIHNLYAQSYGDKPGRLAEAQSEDASKRTYYGLEPSLFVLYDEVNFPENPRQELKLGEDA